jgi:hypothetical protein
MKILTWLTEIWPKIKKTVYLILAVLSVLSIAYISGCVRGRRTAKCPTISTEVVILHDTATHYIPNYVPWYIAGKDTTIYIDRLIPAKVDTLAILRDYYALHYQDRFWSDSLIQVTLKDMITQNKATPQKFTYKILRPQTIINNTQDNSVHYQSYLYIGGSVPINKFDYSSIDLTLALPKWSIGVSYAPGVNTFMVRAGVKIIAFKKK